MGIVTPARFSLANNNYTVCIKRQTQTVSVYIRSCRVFLSFKDEASNNFTDMLNERFPKFLPHLFEPLLHLYVGLTFEVTGLRSLKRGGNQQTQLAGDSVNREVEHQIRPHALRFSCHAETASCATAKPSSVDEPCAISTTRRQPLPVKLSLLEICPITGLQPLRGFPVSFMCLSMFAKSARSANLGSFVIAFSILAGFSPSLCAASFNASFRW